MTGREMFLTEDSIISAPYCDTPGDKNGETKKMETHFDDARACFSVLIGP